jgi:hypothetical protein
LDCIWVAVAEGTQSARQIGLFFYCTFLFKGDHTLFCSLFDTQHKSQENLSISSNPKPVYYSLINPAKRGLSVYILYVSLRMHAKVYPVFPVSPPPD